MKADNNIELVSPEQFRTKLAEDKNAYLLDVRTPDEYAEGHLENSHLLNWLDNDTFKQRATDIPKSKTVYVYCRSGRRSDAAARYLSAQGYKVVDMDGGILEWERDGLPVTTATK